ncbi:MAG: hypothetical protein JW984_15410 [Deltaproteobacteria bacterium]|uniref:DUF2147 domain-containing protein n=1 Tax=Candidatus Zymogenus saltonus TaxID=2844893 RepID=A0A9D8KH55_9DELT|nr:hypothetical protein [Candidatus Zymogenus saltonus]
MKKSALILTISILMTACLSTLAFGEELKVQNSLFVDVAIIDFNGKIYDANRWTLGTYNLKGIVYNQSFEHIGFVEQSDGVSEVKDIHYKVMAKVAEDGEITDADGNLMGKITETKITDKDGRLLFRLSGSMVQKGLLVYLFFFNDTFRSK